MNCKPPLERADRGALARALKKKLGLEATFPYQKAPPQISQLRQRIAEVPLLKLYRFSPPPATPAVQETENEALLDVFE